MSLTRVERREGHEEGWGLCVGGPPPGHRGRVWYRPSDPNGGWSSRTTGSDGLSRSQSLTLTLYPHSPGDSWSPWWVPPKDVEVDPRQKVKTG